MNILTLEPSMASLCWEGVWASLVSLLLFVLVLRVFWGIFFFLPQDPATPLTHVVSFYKRDVILTESLFPILSFLLSVAPYLYLCSFILGNDFDCEPRKTKLNPTVSFYQAWHLTYGMDLDILPHFFVSTILFYISKIPLPYPVSFTKLDKFTNS